MAKTEDTIAMYREELAFEMAAQPIKGAILAGKPSAHEQHLYRYVLWRIWESALEPLAVIMLNPSTADARSDDQTIRRLLYFAHRDGYGGIIVVNLYAYRATDPHTLLTVGLRTSEGEKNDDWIRAVCAGRDVLIAWGNDRGSPRVMKVLDMVRPIASQILSLGYNKDGSPPHPARLPNIVKLVPWPRPESTDA